MKNLITFGCSFTDIDNEYLISNKGKTPIKYREPHKTWSVELARLTDSNPICKGKGAAGNSYIANKIYETVDDSDNSVVIVMWSGIDRIDMAVSKMEFDYFDKNTIKDNWLHSGGKFPFDNSKSKDGYWLNYYKTYHTEEDSYLQTLQHIIGAQEFLSNRKIPYLFLTYKDIFTDRYRKYKRAKNLENQVNWDKFHFPDLWCGGEFGGEYEWVRDNNLTWKEDNEHPSSESHRKFAEYLYNLDECRYLFK
tara:strand:- start:121 stop:870 length:750 start_codon:yes stop_codon:yes gene_type:complete